MPPPQTHALLTCPTFTQFNGLGCPYWVHAAICILARWVRLQRKIASEIKRQATPFTEIPNSSQVSPTLRAKLGYMRLSYMKQDLE